MHPDLNLEEAGATPEEGLRYWRAKEAMRQGELKLSAQSSALATFEGRAQAILGWQITAATAIFSSFFFLSIPLYLRGAAVLAFPIIFWAIYLGWSLLRPSEWRMPGSPRACILSKRASELLDLEAFSLGYASAIDENDRRLKEAGATLTRSLDCLAFAPLGALMGAALEASITRL